MLSLHFYSFALDICLGHLMYPSIYFKLKLKYYDFWAKAHNTFYGFPQIEDIRFDNQHLCSKFDFWNSVKVFLNFKKYMFIRLEQIWLTYNYFEIYWKKKNVSQYCQPINHRNYRWNMLKMQMFHSYFKKNPIRRF